MTINSCQYISAALWFNLASMSSRIRGVYSKPGFQSWLNLSYYMSVAVSLLLFESSPLVKCGQFPIPSPCGASLRILLKISEHSIWQIISAPQMLYFSTHIGILFQQMTFLMTLLNWITSKLFLSTAKCLLILITTNHLKKKNSSFFLKETIPFVF